MTLEISYTQARAQLAKLLDEVTLNQEIVIIKRRRGENAAIISESELTSLLETVHLLRSPANAERLRTAVDRALKNEGQSLTLDELRREVGLGPETA